MSFASDSISVWQKLAWLPVANQVLNPFYLVTNLPMRNPLVEFWKCATVSCLAFSYPEARPLAAAVRQVILEHLQTHGAEKSNR